MKAFALATPDDLRGFALAGVLGAACVTEADVVRAASEVRARRDVALVIVSEAVLQLAPDVIATLEKAPPAVVVLP